MLKKLKSIFIIEEGKPTKSESKSSANSPSSSKKIASKPTANISETTNKSSDKFVNILLEAIEKNNIEGFDYLEYKQSLQSLSKIQMDEATQFKSAFAMASTMGVDKKKLVTSVKRYISVLKEEESKFNIALENQKKQRVNKRQGDLQLLQSEIADKEKQIELLNKQIEKSKQKLSTINNAISGAESKMLETRSSFYGSYQVVFSQMESDLKKINQYL